VTRGRSVVVRARRRGVTPALERRTLVDVLAAKAGSKGADGARAVVALRVVDARLEVGRGAAVRQPKLCMAVVVTILRRQREECGGPCVSFTLYHLSHIRKCHLSALAVEEYRNSASVHCA
jgi:hypothetical protein